MKVLNLYAGIGGNRKLWDGVDVTAVEWDANVACVYMDYFPNDEVVVSDAHEYLLENYEDFDFIWSSPPCPSHSKLRHLHKKKMFPDLKLYEEIIFLQTWFDGKWIVENVTPYYEPLIPATKSIHRHLFWSNFRIPNIEMESLQTCKVEKEREFLEEKFGYDLDQFKGLELDKRKALRNCVVPELGLHIFNAARNIFERPNTEQATLF